MRRRVTAYMLNGLEAKYQPGLYFVIFEQDFNLETGFTNVSK